MQCGSPKKLHVHRFTFGTVRIHNHFDLIIAYLLDVVFAKNPNIRLEKKIACYFIYYQMLNDSICVALKCKYLLEFCVFHFSCALYDG